MAASKAAPRSREVASRSREAAEAAARAASAEAKAASLSLVTSFREATALASAVFASCSA